MAYRFVNTGDRVDCGTAASLDFTEASIFTFIAWFYVETFTSNRAILQKLSSGPTTGPLLRLSGTTDLQMFVQTSGTNASAISNNASLALDTWYFAAGTYDNTDSQDCRLYLGAIGTPAVELAYGTNTSHTDAWDNGNGNCFIGGSTTANLQGRIALAGIWNRRLSLAELQTQQQQPQVTTGCVLLHNLWQNTDPQSDLSGQGNHGTIIGAQYVTSPSGLIPSTRTVRIAG